MIIVPSDWRPKPPLFDTVPSAYTIHSIVICQFSSVQSLSRVWLFAVPWTAARQASLSITNSWSLLRLMSMGLVMPSNHLILCSPLVLLPSVFPSIRVFSKESVLHIRWPKYWSVSFSISPSNEYSGLISFRKVGQVGLKYLLHNLLVVWFLSQLLKFTEPQSHHTEK